MAPIPATVTPSTPRRPVTSGLWPSSGKRRSYSRKSQSGRKGCSASSSPRPSSAPAPLRAPPPAVERAISLRTLGYLLCIATACNFGADFVISVQTRFLVQSRCRQDFRCKAVQVAILHKKSTGEYGQDEGPRPLRYPLRGVERGKEVRGASAGDYCSGDSPPSHNHPTIHLRSGSVREPGSFGASAFCYHHARAGVSLHMAPRLTTVRRMDGRRASPSTA